MMRKMSMKKGMGMLLGGLLTVSLLAGGGSALMAQAENTGSSSSTSEDESTNMYLGVTVIDNPTTATDSSERFGGSYVYFGTNAYTKDTSALKFRVLQNETKYTSGAKNRLLLDCDEVLWTAQKTSRDKGTITKLLNGSGFWNNCLDSVQQSAVTQNGDNDKVFLLNTRIIGQPKYGYAKGTSGSLNNKLVSATLKKGSAYWLEKDYGYIRTEGSYQSSNEPETAGVSPALYLDTSKVLFTKNVTEAGSEKSNNPEYKLTLLDDNLKLENATALSVGFDMDKDNKVTFPVTLEGAEKSSIRVMLLVTDSSTGGGTDRTDFSPSGNIIYYGNAEYKEGNVTFTYDSNWENKYIFLVAEKNVEGNYTNTASTPLYLGEVRQLISSIEIELKMPLADMDTYVNNVSDLPDAGVAFKAEITTFNDTPITALENDSTSPISITAVTSDASANEQIKFNTNYKLTFQITNNNQDYKFDEKNLEVTIKYKQKSSDEDTSVIVKAVAKDGNQNGKITINNSATLDNAIALEISDFTVTTRKARFINKEAAFEITSDATTINYAATYQKVQEYLKAGKDEYIASVPVEGGGTEPVPVQWVNSPHNTFRENNTAGGNFTIEGTLVPSEVNEKNVEFPDGTSKKVFLSVNMNKQEKAGTPQIADVDENHTSDNHVKVGHKIRISPAETSNWTDSTIYYTSDGTDPNDSASTTRQYFGGDDEVEIELTPDKLLSTIKVQAYASRGDDLDSETVSETYTFASNNLTAVDGSITYDYSSEIKDSQEGSGSDAGTSGEDSTGTSGETSTSTTASANVLWGATVKATAKDKTSEGKIFTGWTVKSGDSDCELTLQGEKAQLTDKEITFEMPNQALTLTATYKEVKEPAFATEGQPKAQEVKDGESAAFSVALTYPTDKYEDSNFSYQWQVKDTESAKDTAYTDINGATSKDYKIEKAACADSGKVYRCIVKYTSVVDKQEKILTSKSATLTVNQKTGGLQFETDLLGKYEIEDGKGITFTVKATPGYTDNTLSYQWYCAANTTDGGTVIDDATASSYTISEATIADHDGKVYYCIVSEKIKGTDTVLETRTSTKATLTVSNKPSHRITITGGKATVNGKEVTTAQEGTEVTIKADKQENKKFTGWSPTTTDVKVADAFADTTTFTMPDSEVTITANFVDDYSITISKQPEKASVPAGQSATFTVSASCYPSTAGLSYQWQVAEDGSNTFTNMDGKTEASLTVDNTTSAMSGNRYRCVITFEDSTHKDVSVTSDPALLTVEAASYTITVNNGTASAATGKGGEVITIKANDAPEGQEFKKWTVTSGSASFADATATETTFTMPNKDVEVTAEFQTKLAAPTITKQPENATVYAGTSTSFTIEATGEEMSYQWQVDKTDGKGFQNISGATNTSYRIYTEDGSMNGYKYKCVVSNRSASVESNTVTLTVNYKITEGAKSTWKKSSRTGLTFQGNGAYAKFSLIKVDGKLVGAGNYTKKSDPTIVTLIASYLETLSTGEHTLTMVWSDGTAETTFTVSDSSSTSNSGTSSSSSSGSSSSKSSSSSSSTTGSTSSSTTKKSSSSSATADMPVVNRYKDTTTKDTTDTAEKTTEETKAEDSAGTESTDADTATSENGSVITTLSGDLDEKPSKLNRYAAAASIAVIGLSAAGGIVAFLTRKIRKNDEE